MYHDKKKKKKRVIILLILIVLIGLAIFLNSEKTEKPVYQPVKVVTKQPEPPKVEKVVETTPEPINPVLAPKPEPKYKTKWQNKDAKGKRYSELFTHTSEDMTGIEAKVASGTYKLSHKNGVIYQVSFRQTGESCQLKLKDVGNDFGNIEIIEAAHAFKWRSEWEGKPCDETYEAFYEIPLKVCIADCN